MKIKNKKEFYELSERGLCGNTPRVWIDWDEFSGDSRRPEYVGIRRTIFSHERGYPRVLVTAARDLTEKMRRGTYIISEVPGPEIEGQRGLQGELTWFQYAPGKAGWVLYYTHTLGYMRARLAESGRHAYGYAALRLLRGYCDPSEMRELMELFDRYTDEETGRYPVIEFAIFNHPWGRLNRNLIIWEIRNGY